MCLFRNPPTLTWLHSRHNALKLMAKPTIHGESMDKMISMDGPHHGQFNDILIGVSEQHRRSFNFWGLCCKNYS
jgi:hypothetical protein